MFSHISVLGCTPTVVLLGSVVAVLELSSSVGSHVCINTDIPEIFALRDRFLLFCFFV